MYSLATAAAACGVSKSVILRAIIAGKLSGSKDKHGEWHVEPAPRYAAPPDATALAQIDKHVRRPGDTASIYATGDEKWPEDLQEKE